MTKEQFEVLINMTSDGAISCIIMHNVTHGHQKFEQCAY